MMNLLTLWKLEILKRRESNSEKKGKSGKFMEDIFKKKKKKKKNK